MAAAAAEGHAAALELLDGAVRDLAARLKREERAVEEWHFEFELSAGLRRVQGHLGGPAAEGAGEGA